MKHSESVHSQRESQRGKKLSLLFFLGLTSWVGLSLAIQNLSYANQIVVGITQIVEHPALDQEREGIVLALKKAGYVEGNSLRIVYQNAQGSTVNATQIAQRLVGLQPRVIVAISTPASQAALAAIGNQKIPLVFTAVTDPVGARLVKSLKQPSSGVTGVTDRIPAEVQLQFVQRFVPRLKTLGVIFNPGETNSSTIYRELLEKSASFGLKIISATASRSSEVMAAAQSLVGRVEAIYVPNDNTAVSSIESIVRVGRNYQLPVLAGDIGSVLRGAVASVGHDHRALGVAAGERVVRILRGQSPDQIPIETSFATQITINRDAAKRMGVQIPTIPGNQARFLGE